jgi:hypothetical protein
LKNEISFKTTKITTNMTSNPTLNIEKRSKSTFDLTSFSYQKGPILCREQHLPRHKYFVDIQFVINTIF